MNLDHLRAFLRVIELGGLSRAAPRLHLSQPALSRQMRLLEESVGVTLFERTGRGLSPTAAGRRLESRIRPLLAELDSLPLELSRDADAIRGPVSLAVSPSVGSDTVASVIQTMRQRHPAAQVRVGVGLSGAVREGLLDGRYDLGILYPTVQSESLSTERLWREELHLVGPPGSGLGALDAFPFEEALNEPLLLPSPPHGLRILLEGYAAARGRALGVAIEVDSLRLLVALVRAGEGRAILSRRAIAAELTEGLLEAVRVVDPILLRSTLLAWPSSRAPSRAARALREILRDHVREPT